MGLHRGITYADKDIAVGTLGPLSDVRRVDSVLDVGAVKVDGGTSRQEVEAAGEAKYIPQHRAVRGNLVDVEARIYCEHLAGVRPYMSALVIITAAIAAQRGIASWKRWARTQR